MDRRSFLRSLPLAAVGVAIAPLLPKPVEAAPLFTSGGIACRQIQVSAEIMWEVDTNFKEITGRIETFDA